MISLSTQQTKDVFTHIMTARKVIHRPTLPFNVRRRFFSSTSGYGVKSLNDFSGYVTNDGERMINLPSITLGVEFKRDLKNVLSVLGKENKVYKLDYYLYIRSNENKKLLSLLTSENYIGSILDNSVRKNGCISKEQEVELKQYIIALKLLDKQYKYKGFSVIHSTKFDNTTLHVIDEYINNIYTLLGKCVVYINEECLDIDEFIEFKKSSILKVTTINNSDNLV